MPQEKGQRNFMAVKTNKCNLVSDKLYQLAQENKLIVLFLMKIYLVVRKGLKQLKNYLTISIKR